MNLINKEYNGSPVTQKIPKNCGYVYSILFGNGLVKIGKTKNFEKRLQQLTNSNSHHTDVEIHIVSNMIENYSSMETHLLEKYKSFRRYGEYFDIDFDLVCEDIIHLEEISIERIDLLLEEGSAKAEEGFNYIMSAFIPEKSNEVTLHELETKAKSLKYELPKTYLGALKELVVKEEENQKLLLEIDHKQEVIIELVDNLDLVRKRYIP